MFSGCSVWLCCLVDILCVQWMFCLVMLSSGHPPCIVDVLFGYAV